ncbi:hypothetical protein ACPSKX_08385 [Moritella viscosa]
MSQQSVIQVALIEDDEIVRLAISQRLQLAGHDVIECAWLTTLKCRLF